MIWMECASRENEASLECVCVSVCGVKAVKLALSASAVAAD